MLSLAQAIKRDIVRLESHPAVTSQVIPPQEYYIDNDTNKKHIPYRDIKHNNDARYTAWRTVHECISFRSNTDTVLLEWVLSASDEDIATRIEGTLTGLEEGYGSPAFAFTKFQRLFLSVICDSPFDVEVDCRVSKEQIWNIVNYHSAERKPQQALHACYSVLKGSIMETILCDLDTGAGKTPLMCCAMATLLASRFEHMIDRHYQKRLDTIFQGTCASRVARCCLIAAAAATFQHFEHTVLRLIPQLQRRWPHLTFEVWTSSSNAYNLERVVRLRDTIVFWIVEMKSVNDVLRRHPDIAIAAALMDEFTIDTPKTRRPGWSSSILTCAFLQATPQNLQKASEGCHSLLKNFFDGKIESPSSIHRYIKSCKFKEAQTAMFQTCKLFAASTTPFRRLISDDLADLVPVGLDVLFKRTSHFTLASSLSCSSTELLPPSFRNVLRKSLLTVPLSNDSIKKITEMPNNVVTLEGLITYLKGFQLADSTPVEHNPTFARLVTRIEDFATSNCPICFNSPDSLASAQMFSCCGYMICIQCNGRLHSQNCPFCRSLICNELPQEEVIDLDETFSVWDIPGPPCFSEASTFDEDIKTLIPQTSSHLTAMTLSLHIARKHDYKRIIVCIEEHRHPMRLNLVDEYLNLPLIGVNTGYEFRRIHLSGKGTSFSRIKADFNNCNRGPMALFVVGMDASFLTGTDLPAADCCITVGEIDSEHITQAMGRFFRPLASRDNTRSFKLVKIYSGVAPMRRRRRE